MNQLETLSRNINNNVSIDSNESFVSLNSLGSRSSVDNKSKRHMKVGLGGKLKDTIHI